MVGSIMNWFPLSACLLRIIGIYVFISLLFFKQLKNGW